VTIVAKAVCPYTERQVSGRFTDYVSVVKFVPELAPWAESWEGVLSDESRDGRHTSGEVAQAGESPVLHQGGYHMVGGRGDVQHAGCHEHLAVVLLALLGNIKELVPLDVSLHQRQRYTTYTEFDMRVLAHVEPDVDYPVLLCEHVAAEEGLHGRELRPRRAFVHEPEGIRSRLGPREGELHREGLEISSHLPTSDAASVCVVNTGRSHIG
jgi:hypothetical protein